MLAPAYTAYRPTALSLAQAPAPQVDVERKHAMKEAWRAYRGEFQDPLKIAHAQPNDNVKANRCGPIVLKGVSFLFGQSLTIECGDEDMADDTKSVHQDFLDGLWGDDDDKMTTLSQIGINGAVCGQAFVKIIPARRGQKYPRIVTLDPMLVRVVTMPDDCETVLAYIIEYPGTAEWQKKQIIARVDMDMAMEAIGEEDVQDTWTIANYLRKGQTGNWQQVGATEDWPWPFAPIFSCQNMPNPNEFWGMPDLTPDLILMNKVLCFIESNVSRIIKYHGHPKTVATGVRAEQISIAVDDVLCLPDPASKLEALKAMDNFAGLLAFIENIRSNMDEQSRVPSVALGRLAELPKGNISGVALQLLFQPLIEKTVQKQRLYGRLIRAIARAALVMVGHIPQDAYEDYPIDLHWQNLLPVDDLLAAQTAQIWKNIGVSTRTLITGAGFDPDAEEERIADEQEKNPPPAPPPLPGMPMPGQPPQDGQAQQQGGIAA